MANFNWQDRFLGLFDKCLVQYQKGNQNPASYYSPDDIAFLKSIGCRQREFFDFVEDYADGAPLPPASAMLIAAVRRDYFRAVQHQRPSAHVIVMADLPAKSAELDGIRWLPRIIAKARAKLRGEMPPDLMYACGGDRAFLSEHDIHPADFLRAVWAAGDDDRKILDFVKGA